MSLPMAIGAYRARVVTNDDQSTPWEGRGYVRVRIPELHPESVLDKDLPWAAPMFPVGLTGLPVEGDWVWVCFEHGDPRAPLYLGLCRAPEDLRARLGTDWPDGVREWRNPDGSVRVGLTGSKVEVQAGTAITLVIDAENKKMEVDVGDDGEFNVLFGQSGPSIRMSAETVTIQLGDVSLRCDGDLTIQAGSIRLTGADGVDIRSPDHVRAVAQKVQGFERHGY